MATTHVGAAGGPRWILASFGLLSCLLCGCPGPSTAEHHGNQSGPLEAMKTAYQQASTYADAGELHMEIAERGQKNEVQPIPFSVSMQRPNKLRVDACGASLVCDGKHFWSVVADQEMSDQVLFREAPAEFTVKQIYDDPVLEQMLSDNTGLRLTQLELLLADNSLADVFGAGFQAKRLEDQPLADDEDRRYQVVEVTGERGKFVGWIDPKTHVLRRLEIPSEPFENRYDPEHRATFRVWIDFKGAEIGKQIDEQAFKFEAPPSARLMKRFVPPPPALREPPNELLGRRPDSFKFVDMQGNPVDLESLKGKIAVMDMWTVSCGWCFRSFPNLEKVYRQYQHNDKVEILTVNNDEASFTDKTVQAAFTKAGLNLPIVRDPERYAQSVFKVPGWPAMVMLGADGTVQDFELGYKSDLAESLPKKIDRLLAGENLAQEVLAKFDRERREFELRKTQEMVGATQQIELPQATIGQRTEPASLKLTKLWTADGIKNPGNLLVLGDDAEPRILVLDGWSKVVEVDTAGKVVTEHALKLPTGSAITQLRTAVDAQGHRYFAAFASTQQQVYVFDSDWKQQFSYPEGKHAGISDVQLGDLDGDGVLELNIAYLGEVGVQNVSLEGKRLWSNRSLDNVLSLAVLEPDAENHRQLYCANEREALGVIDYQGQLLADIPVADRGVDVIVAADLDGQPPLKLAALAAPKPAELLAIGLDQKGRELWSYPLPIGVRSTPCDPLVAGRVIAEGPGQWLLTGPDGSIHILAADGTPVDKFSYGTGLTGIGSAQVDGRPLLLVATAKDLVAWSVESAHTRPDDAAAAETGTTDPETTDPETTDAKRDESEPGESVPAEDEPAPSEPEEASPLGVESVQ